MSKSLDNAILLSDDNDTIRKKVMSMYTDPNRIHASDPGTVENNPLWIFHDAFNPDKQWVSDTKDLYRSGKIGDVACKKKLVDVLVDLITPIRERRQTFESDLHQVKKILQAGGAKARSVAETTLNQAKASMKQIF